MCAHWNQRHYTGRSAAAPPRRKARILQSSIGRGNGVGCLASSASTASCLSARCTNRCRWLRPRRSRWAPRLNRRHPELASAPKAQCTSACAGAVGAGGYAFFGTCSKLSNLKPDRQKTRRRSLCHLAMLGAPHARRRCLDHRRSRSRGQIPAGLLADARARCAGIRDRSTGRSRMGASPWSRQAVACYSVVLDSNRPRTAAHGTHARRQRFGTTPHRRRRC